MTLIGLLLLAACNGREAEPQVLNPSLLASQFFQIDPAINMELTTQKGATIKIPAGTFNKAVRLEIKEAYSMADMLLGGLATEADGRPLQSDGMIYINVAGREAVKLNKPIEVSIPGDPQAGMQLFKGVENEQGAVNWTEPLPLVATRVPDTIRGKELFMSKCATCHNVNRQVTGPALAGVEKRVPDKKLLYAWVRNNQAVLKLGNVYFRKLYNCYNKTPMNIFPELEDADVEDILAYIRSVEDTSRMVFNECDPRWASDTIPVNDSSWARYDTSYSMTGPVYIQYTIVDSAGIIMYDSLFAASMEASLRRGFTDAVSTDSSYNFSINTLGWYNIDAFVQGLPGTELCDLKVEPAGTEKMEKINVYLFIPDRKNLSVGGLYPDGTFHFEKISGKIPLHLGDKAFALAFGNDGEQFYYGITGFRIKQAQQVKVKLAKVSREEFLRQVKELKFEGIQFDVSR
jgi:mono/diheme cytochrome c family protein